MQIAVLALQGAFIEHEQMLARRGVSTIELCPKSDLIKLFDGLIIPGAEVRCRESSSVSSICSMT